MKGAPSVAGTMARTPPVPLRVPAFRALWLGGTAFFVGNAMQNMAASWLMLQMTGSAALTALVQTAAFLPMFLLSLPAGVLADVADRRRVMQVAQAGYVVLAALLTLVAALDALGAATLLVFTFLLGLCSALQSPSWNSTVSDTVGDAGLPQAVTLISMAFNGARAAGPALAGLIFSAAGAATVFSLSLLTAAWMVLAVRAHPPARRPPGRLPPERLWVGLTSGLRFARHSPAIAAQLVRIAVFTGIGSALWALLPAVAERRLGLGPSGFGLLMGCLGSGAVAVGFVIGPLRQRWPLDRLVVACSLVVGLAMTAAAALTQPWLVCPALVVGGAAWMAVTSSLNAATQTSAAEWVRARANSLHVLCSLGAFAVGAALWGWVSAAFGLQAALLLAALALAASALLVRPFPLRLGLKAEVTLAEVAPLHGLAEEPALEDGPVAVEVVFEIRPEDAAAFIADMEALVPRRRRDGGRFWRLYRDLGEPTRYVERFIVQSWGDYLRQRERASQADEALEAQVRRWQMPGRPVTLRHYLAQR